MICYQALKKALTKLAKVRTKKVKNNKPNYNTFYPPEVRYNPNISAGAKILYGEIAYLAQEKGYCDITNQTLADYYDVTKETVSKWISILIKQGYLTREVFRDSNNQVTERRLYILNIGQ